MKALYIVILVRKVDSKVETYNIIWPEEDIAEERDKIRARELVDCCAKKFGLNLDSYLGAGVHKVPRDMMEEVLA